MSGNILKYIYFIKAGDFVKIGITTNPKKRLHDLQTSNPLKLDLIYFMPGDENLEKILHEVFDEYKESGEWFRFESGLRTFVYSFRNNGFWIGQKYSEIPPSFPDITQSAKKARDEIGIFFEAIESIQDEYGGRAPVNILLEYLLDVHEIPIELSKKLILRFKRRGRIYEPWPGYLRVA